MTSVTTAAHRAEHTGAVRSLGWLGLGVAELAVLTVLFDLDLPIPRVLNPVSSAVTVAQWAIVTGAVLLVTTWQRRGDLKQAWTGLQAGHDWAPPLAAHLVLFVLLALATGLVAANGGTIAAMPWLLVPFAALLGAAVLSLPAIDVPLTGLARLAWAWRAALAPAALAGLAIMLAGRAAVHSWDLLAAGTLHLSGWLIGLVDPSVVVDTVEPSLRVGQFRAIVMEACSGYEGLALVTGFLGIYLWTFRADLRWPAALLLLPIGLTAMWVLNSLRIAALTLIGAHVSPHLAVMGFHSQAGWIAFVAVSLALMGLARCRPFVLATAAGAGPGTGHIGQIGQRPARSASPLSPELASGSVPYLMPFVALMLGTMATSVAAPYDRPVYLVKVLLVAAALVACRAAYRRLDWRCSGEALAVGAAVGMIWIATAEVPEPASALGDWLAGLPPEMAATWLAARAAGTVVLVPIAEELAFRGYLYRRIQTPAFETASLRRLSATALVASSLLFGLMHDRWLAGTLAGATFTLVMLRNGRLQDAIGAHSAANAVIFAWAVAWRQWHLL